VTEDGTGGVEVCKVDELPPGTCRIVVAGGRRIGVFNVHGSYYALLDRCPHGGAPLCRGRIGGLSRAEGPGPKLDLVREGEILRCPWHGWEFEISSGETVTQPIVRVKTFKAEAKDGCVLVEV
jgi:nitrite reductase/ring-hydroxylating ferredoxin subunit